MGRWSGLSSLIDFHFEHGHGSYRNGKSGVNLTTRYHKLDDSIFVLCRNCGQSMKTDDLKKAAGYAGPQSAQRQKTNPKHFLTWSATAANNKIQKMSKNLANNISKLQMKVEKAIPFQQGVNALSSEEFCSGSCESGKASQSSEQFLRKDCNDQDNNNSSFRTNPDVVVNVPSKIQSDDANASYCSTSKNSISSSANLASNVVKQCEENSRYHYHTRVQNARIVQSHPSVSHTHSHGSIANPDKILQINIDSYQKYSSKELNSFKNIKDKSTLLKNIGVDVHTNGSRHKNALQLEMQPIGLINTDNTECYDSGTGSGNTSMSDSSLSTVTTLPISSLNWSRASSVSALGSNLNSSSPTLNQQHPQLNCDNNSNSKSLCNKMTVKVNSPVVNNGKEVVINQHDSNSTNSGVPITESTDETSLLIDNNKSNHKKGILRIGCVRNVEIRNNNKNLVPTQDQKLGNPIATSTPLKIQSLISQAYPPSKLTVTIFEEEAELRHAPWFQAGIPREIALEFLRNEPIGSFIVRESTTKSGCFALSLRVPKEFQPSGIAHYLILKTSRGYKIKGFTKEFGSLTKLITHHSVMAELLPCPLSLHQYRPKHTLRVSRANSSDFMEHEKLIIGAFTNF